MTSGVNSNMSSSVYGTSSSASTQTSGTNQLDKNSFLQLMVTQMQYQDPFQPQDNTQFIAQLAQFTSLEQMTNIAQSQSELVQVMAQTMGYAQLGAAHQLVGSNVTLTDETGSQVTGTVSGVKIVNGEAQIVVGGQSYSLDSIDETE